MSTPKHWLITGASRGLGRALAEAALQRGDRVLAISRDATALQHLQATEPQACQSLVLDITDGAALEAQLPPALDAFGGLDILVNNAGVGMLASVEDSSPQLTRANFEVNFFAPMRVIQLLLPRLRAQRQGQILTISAAAAIGNYPGFGVYGAAKAALESLHESLRQEVMSLGIGVSLIQPGPLRTDFIANLTQGDIGEAYQGNAGRFARYLQSVQGKQTGSPQRAAQLLVELAHEGRLPFRLPLGAYAVNKARERAATALRDWEPLMDAARGVDSPP
jgi:NAD(P)-dependent dehydrogenase (short-subunit alcohol dehydrogenase family)